MKPLHARFPRLGLERKFVLSAAGTVVVALALTSVGLLVHEYRSLRYEMPRAIGGVADLLAHNCAAPLAFHDPEAASEALESIVSMPEIHAAWVTTPDGVPFAVYGASGGEPPPIEIMGASRYLYDAQSLFVAAPVILASERIGTVYLQASLDQFWDRIFFGAAVIVVIAASSFLISSYLASRLFRILTTPLLRLNDTMRAVSRRNDYSLRAPDFTVQDEIGQLIAGFNSMLDRIEERDADIRRGRVILEKILAGTSPLTGDDFCRRLAQLLGELLEVEAVAVWEIPEASESRGRLCGAWCRDERIWPKEWSTRGTMFERILQARIPIFLKDARTRYEEDPVLQVFGEQDGFAVPLVTGANEALGAIVLFRTGPVEDRTFLESIVTIFAARTAAELERMRTERLKNEFLGMVSHEIRTPLAILQVTSEGFAMTEDGSSIDATDEKRR
ncbi:MAG: CHASE sensor domain-containing protein, partial [Candidatus Hydrogenedentota bacterium]